MKFCWHTIESNTATKVPHLRLSCLPTLELSGQALPTMNVNISHALNSGFIWHHAAGHGLDFNHILTGEYRSQDPLVLMTFEMKNQHELSQIKSTTVETRQKRLSGIAVTWMEELFRWNGQEMRNPIGNCCAMCSMWKEKGNGMLCSGNNPIKLNRNLCNRARSSKSKTTKMTA